MNTNRDITEHFFYSTGDSMKAKSGMIIKFVMEISENIYNEQDKSKNCQNYPNENFASYFDCEEHFVQQTCQSYGVAPIWLFEDLKNVTRDPVHSPGIFSQYDIKLGPSIDSFGRIFLDLTGARKTVLSFF